MASLLLSNEEVDALSWVELKRKCQESYNFRKFYHNQKRYHSQTQKAKIFAKKTKNPTYWIKCNN